MKYKIINSDILLNNKLIPQNSEVELSAEEIKGIEDYLSRCHPEPVEGSKPTEEILNDTVPNLSHSERSRTMTEDYSTNELKPKSKRSKK